MTQLSFMTMNHSAFLGCDARLTEQVRAAAAAGYELFGPDLFSVLQLEQQGTAVDELASLIAREGMRCFEIAALAIYDDRETTMQGARELARVARVLGPEWVMANDLSTSGLPAQVDECATLLAEVGVGLGFEMLPWTPMASIARTLEYVGRARAAGARAAVIVDTWHIFRGPDGLEGLDQLKLDDVAYVQFDDALPTVSGDMLEETLHRRVMPGQGEFGLVEFCERMRALGYDGPVSVEILSSEWRARPLPEFIATTYEAARRFWPA